MNVEQTQNSISETQNILSYSASLIYHLFGKILIIKKTPIVIKYLWCSISKNTNKIPKKKKEKQQFNKNNNNN